ncbi:unnamed protein product [Haemonchus placei]|uniref:Secreted protein n=1 Tax=Haemonchus placei TaxID=6290 RepID=A0A0N4WCB4_HAEPC|nr:unnamed protein product [Haemonchus placei]
MQYLTLIFPLGLSGGIHLRRTSFSLIKENATPDGTPGTSSGVNTTVGILFSGPHPTMVQADTKTK